MRVRNFGMLLGLLIVVPSFTACKKKKPGVCYCKYASGDKKEFNLSNLPRNEQQDSCSVLNSNAGPFGGECDLK